jgi:hypothetical protein
MYQLYIVLCAKNFLRRRSRSVMKSLLIKLIILLGKKSGDMNNKKSLLNRYTHFP